MLPIQVTIRDIPLSIALETHIRKKAEKLTHDYPRISRCQVVVDMQQKHKHQGKVYKAHINLTLPGKKELVANHHEDQDVYVAIRDMFNAIERQLEEYVRMRQGKRKKHESVEYGTINRLVENEGYGFIDGEDGNEYYFSTTQVNFPRFELLKPGDKVEFVPQLLNHSLQASHVVRNGKE